MLRLNILTVERNLYLTSIQVNGLKISVVQNQKFYNCVKIEDIVHYKSYITKARLDLVRNSNNYDVTLNLLEEAVIFWCTNFHLRLLTLIREIEDFIHGMKQAFSWKIKKKKNDCNRVYKLRTMGMFNFHVKISEEHNIKATFGMFLFIKFFFLYFYIRRRGNKKFSAQIFKTGFHFATADY